MQSFLFINQYASTPDTGFGGRYFYLAKSLSELGHKVTLVTSGNHHLLSARPVVKGLWRKEEIDGLSIIWLKTIPYNRANSAVRVLNWFLFAFYLPFLFLFGVRAQKVHYSSPSPVGFIGAWLLAKISASNLFFDVRDVWPETLVEIGGVSRSHPLVWILSVIERFCYKKADLVTSNLSSLDIRLNELGVSEDKFSWVPNGIDLPGIQESLLKSDYTLPKGLCGRKVVTYTGTLGEANALYTMLDAAFIMMEEKDFIFYIVGKGKERDELQKYCDDRGISNVVFADPVPKKDVYKLQSLSDVLCVGAKPSPLYRYGVAPNKLYEYMYSGTPVAYYIDTPNYHPVVDAACGEEVASHDALGLANAIRALSQLAPEKLQSNKLAAQGYILKNHTYMELAKRVATL